MTVKAILDADILSEYLKGRDEAPEHNMFFTTYYLHDIL